MAIYNASVGNSVPLTRSQHLSLLMLLATLATPDIAFSADVRPPLPRPQDVSTTHEPSPAAAPRTVIAVAPKPELNQPPRFDRIAPSRYDGEDAIAKLGEELRFTVEVSDPEGLPVTVTALGLPQGAQFSEALRMLIWTPQSSQLGIHLVRFVVSDGTKETSRLVKLVVVKNRPPKFVRPERAISAGSYQTISLEAIDSDRDELTYSAERIPRGAQFDEATGALNWRPTEDDIGEHALRVTAFDGALRTTQEFKIDVESSHQSQYKKDEWGSFLLPGAGYSLYAPRDRGTWGTFHGVSLEVLIAAWIHRNDNRGPSHGRIYINAELLSSTHSQVSLLFGYAAGFSLSLERNPHRKWLLPHYGIDVGGIIHDTLGTHFQTSPYLGLHVYSSPNVFINARFGYRLVPNQIERLGGWHFNVSADLSVW